jgi:arylsulfatase A
MILKLLRFFSLFPVFGIAFHGAADGRPAKPNIIVMMADDMGLGDTSAYLGVRLNPDSDPISRTLRTPQLEDFAKQGVVFTDAYAPASMCSSTRYSLLTGRFAHRAYLKKQGWLPHGPNSPMIQKGMPTLPGMLQGNGYTTAGVGKYHVGMAFDNGYGEVADAYDFSDVDFTKPILDGPTHHGFDEYFGVTGNTEDPLDLEPRNYIRNDRWSFTYRSKMKRIGMKSREGRVLAAPDWDLSKLGPDYLREVKAFIGRQSKSDNPFFLYYVPNANHYQRHPGGDYAVPDEIAGTKIKGQSRYSDGESAGDREDMILENDAAFGELMKTLRQTDDPRWPGHQMIENTLIIFTSDNGPNIGDNLGTNQESGGLRSKKAKIWEGGIRVPMMVYWKGQIEGGTINRTVCSLTDLYATLAKVVGHSLTSMEAQDSHDCLSWWTGEEEGSDERARVFFCHLGPPFLNDVLAIRKGSEKVLVDGGLALPSMAKGRRGASVPIAYYDLDSNLYEEGEGIAPADNGRAEELAAELLRIHNRGYCRDFSLEDGVALIADDGWHNLRNDLDGEIGFEFRLREERVVTHLGMWDDHQKDTPARPARNIPTEFDQDKPGVGSSKRGVITSPHCLLLEEVDASGVTKLIAQLDVSSGNLGEWEKEFRYLPLSSPVSLQKGKLYRLTMSTQAGDGDHFRDPVGFDGLSPVIHPAVEVIRAVLVRDDRVEPISSFSDMHADHMSFRLPVGPTLKFQRQ